MKTFNRSFSHDTRGLVGRDGSQSLIDPFDFFFSYLLSFFGSLLLSVGITLSYTYVTFSLGTYPFLDFQFPPPGSNPLYSTLGEHHSKRRFVGDDLVSSVILLLVYRY